MQSLNQRIGSKILNFFLALHVANLKIYFRNWGATKKALTILYIIHFLFLITNWEARMPQNTFGWRLFTSERGLKEFIERWDWNEGRHWKQDFKNNVKRNENYRYKLEVRWGEIKRYKLEVRGDKEIIKTIPSFKTNIFILKHMWLWIVRLDNLRNNSQIFDVLVHTPHWSKGCMFSQKYQYR